MERLPCEIIVHIYQYAIRFSASGTTGGGAE